jgi:hypothetical protein
MYVLFFHVKRRIRRERARVLFPSGNLVVVITSPSPHTFFFFYFFAV